MPVLEDVSNCTTYQMILVECDLKCCDTCRGIYKSQWQSVRGGLKRNNGKIFCARCTTSKRSTGNAGVGAKYEYDRTALDTIDTEAKAYLLGFFSADGNVQKNGNIRLSLKVTDSECINNMFRSVFGANIPPITYETRPPRYAKNWKRDMPELNTATITLSSKSMVKSICSHLAIEASPMDKHKTKTFTVRAPILDAKLMWAFIRGAWEGDGSCLHPYSKKALQNPAMSDIQLYIMSACPLFLLDIQQFLSANGILTNIRNSDSCKRLHISSKCAREFLDCIYPTGIAETQRLERKYATITEWKHRYAAIDTLAIDKFGGNRNIAIKEFNKQFKVNHPDLYEDVI